MREQLKMVAAVAVAIAGTGLVLDEAGKGTLGQMAQKFAQKVTRGFGV